MSNWTQPICIECWKRERGDDIPVTCPDRFERCCMCCKETDAGIYVRRDPKSVPYPMIEEEA